MAKVLGTDEKALKINLERTIYGSFAEIGAGQEVARQFFQAGAAAGTIAKTMSAYDMAMSDAIYGKERSGRYVCEGRLEKMLKHEFKLLQERLVDDKYAGIRFFVLADTVATTPYGSKRPGHGWIGLRFQESEDSEPSDVHLHIQLKDNQNYLQQEAIGNLGVNLVYACFYHLNKRESFIKSLMDNLNTDRLEIDMIRVEGPAFEEDSRLYNLELIKKQFSQGVIFDENGKAQNPSELLYKKRPLILRGSFRPPTHVNFDMMENGLDQLKKSLPKIEHKNIVLLPEISMAKLLERGKVENEDFLLRVDLLNALGQKVFITNKESFHELSSYAHSLTREEVSFVVGIYNLISIFDPSTYLKHPSGVVAGIGELFSRRTTLFVYPGLSEDESEILNSRSTPVHPKNEALRNLLVDQKNIIDIETYNESYFTIWSREVSKMIESCDSSWEKMVPKIIAKEIKKNNLFGLCEI